MYQQVCYLGLEVPVSWDPASPQGWVLLYKRGQAGSVSGRVPSHPHLGAGRSLDFPLVSQVS